jgi:hypothetical protein
MSAAPTQRACNATMTYSRLTQPADDTSAGLPCHHLQSLLELLASTTVSSSIDSEEDSGGWVGADFFGLDDPRALL